MAFSEDLVTLRDRVHIAKGCRSVTAAAKDIGIAAPTLRRWLEGNNAILAETLLAIEQWCAAQEQAKDGAHA